MEKTIKYGTTLKKSTIERMKEIASLLRWNDNDVIEVAIDQLHKKIDFTQPVSATNNPIISERG